MTAALSKIAAWAFLKWKQLICVHEWTPVHHSYRCDHCTKLDKEF